MSLHNCACVCVRVMQIAKMELRQQHQQHQQLMISSDAINSSYIRVFVIKCINVTLSVLALFFTLISTVPLIASHVTATR